MTFRFVGSESLIGGIALKRFGQRFDLSPSEVSAVYGERGVLALPEEEFDAIGFTDDELKKYQHPATHDSPEAAEFREKKRLAIARAVALQQEGK